MDLTGIGSVANFAKGIMDFVARFFPEKMSESEEAQAMLALQGMIQNRDTMRDQATVQIIQAEMAQGDPFTKRARPSVVYLGLVFIGLVHVVIPILVYMAAIFGKTLPAGMPELKLPAEFWVSWGTVVSIWSIGRSAEKRGAAGRLMSAVTGSTDVLAALKKAS